MHLKTRYRTILQHKNKISTSCHTPPHSQKNGHHNLNNDHCTTPLLFFKVGQLAEDAPAFCQPGWSTISGS